MRETGKFILTSFLFIYFIEQLSRKGVPMNADDQAGWEAVDTWPDETASKSSTDALLDSEKASSESNRDDSQASPSPTQSNTQQGTPFKTDLVHSLCITFVMIETVVFSCV